MQPLTARHYLGLEEQLRGLQPCGQTPLYYALKLAFDEDDFRIDPGPEDRNCIVVITDGENSQASNATTRPDDVLRAREASPRGFIAIHVVGLDMHAPSRELQKLAEATGGRYYDAENDTDSLLGHLRQIIRQPKEGDRSR